MKSLDKNKPSELFEGVNSSLHQTFVKAVERGKETKESLSKVCLSSSKSLSNLDDWHIEWNYLLNKKKWKNPDEVNKVLTKFVEDLLTRQRTELEQQKVKVVWNDVCEQIKQEARSELLEEIKKKEMINTNEETNSDWFYGYGYNQALKDIINLLNKKDE